MKARPAIIVLAAGKGSRFLGEDHKLAQRIGGATVLATTLRQAVASQLRVVAVTTEAFAEVARRSVAARDVVVLPEVGSSADSRLGMGYSIAAGVSVCPDADGWLILPGDMPMVRTATLLELAAALERYPVVYAQYKGRRGHPVGFGAELFSELTGLSGDEGARRLVARYPAFGVELDDPGVLVDVDTQADLDVVRAAQAAAGLAARRP
jgi:molybdenum cofactor cytidylyltransferase